MKVLFIGLLLHCLPLAVAAQAQQPLQGAAANNVAIAWNYPSMTLSFPAGNSTSLTVWNDTLNLNVPAVRNGVQFVAFNIPLAQGLNRLRPVRVPSVAHGAVSAQSEILIRCTGDNPPALMVTPSPSVSEVLPAQTTLNLSFNVPGEVAAEVWVDSDGDGAIESVQPFNQAPVVTYTSAGRYSPLVTVKTQSGHLYTNLAEVTQPVSIVTPTSFAASTLPALPGPIVDSEFSYKSQELFTLSTGPDAITRLNIYTGVLQTFPLNGMYGPGGFGRDKSGNIYIADTGNNRIVKLLASSNYSPDTSISPTGSFGSQGSGNGQLLGPRDVLVMEEAGFTNVLVADTGNHRLQRFDKSGVFKQSIDGTASSSGAFVTPDRLFILDNDVIVVRDVSSGLARRIGTGGEDLGVVPGTYSSTSSIGFHPFTGDTVALHSSSQIIRSFGADGAVTRTIAGIPAGIHSVFLLSGETAVGAYLIPAGGGTLLTGDLHEDPPGEDPVTKTQNLLQAIASQDVSMLAKLCSPTMWVGLSRIIASPQAFALAASAAQSVTGLALTSMGGASAEVRGVTGAETVAFKFQRDGSTGNWRCSHLPWSF